MKKILKILSVVFFVLMSTGCPVSLSEPLDAPNVKVDDSWLGSYYGTLPGDYVWIGYNNWVVSKKSDYEYMMTGRPGTSTKKPEEIERDKRMGYSTTNNEETTYSGHITMIKDKSFLNLYDTIGSYYFFKIESTDKGFLLTEVSVNIGETVKTGEDLKKKIGSMINDADLYGASFTMERK